MSKREPFTVRKAAQTQIFFAVMNLYFLWIGKHWASVGLNVAIAGFMALGLLGERYWPHKMRLRKFGE